jgi:hypothetical protein
LSSISQLISNERFWFHDWFWFSSGSAMHKTTVFPQNDLKLENWNETENVWIVLTQSRSILNPGLSQNNLELNIAR